MAEIKYPPQPYHRCTRRQLLTTCLALEEQRDRALVEVDRLRSAQQRVLKLADKLDALYDQGYAVTDGDEGDGLAELPVRVADEIREAPRRLPLLIRAAVAGEKGSPDG